MQQLTAALLKYIPIYPEESTHYNPSVTRHELLQKLQQDTQKSEAEILLYLAMLERLLSSVAVLNPEALAQAQWQFVSFPAQLNARAFLQVFCDSEQNILEPHFWHVSPITSAHRQEQQHSFLKYLEQQRVKNHQNHAAKPIRHCSISAALIRLDEQFLLHQRSAEAIRDNNGEYNFIGGRTKLEDMAFLKQLSLSEKIALLENPANLPKQVIEATLQREIREETTLEFGRDYQFQLWKTLPPYCKLSGAFYRYSFTEYHFHVYTLSLTQQGILRLLAFEQENPQLFSRFDVSELTEEKIASGKKAYLDALKSAFSSRVEFEAALQQIPNAFENRYASQMKEIILPYSSQHTLRYGKLRYEERLNVNFTDEQCQLLCILGAYAKGFKFNRLAEKELGSLAHYQWVKVLNIDLLEKIKELARLLQQADFPLLELEVIHSHSVVQNYVRFSIEPEAIFFDEKHFNYQLIKPDDKHDWRIQVTRLAICNPWVNIEEEKSCALEGSFVQQLKEVALGRLSFHNNKGLDSNLRKQLDTDINRLGLRKLVRIQNKIYRFTCQHIL
ncbi:MAG: hypothetical protein PHP00_09395 [Thiotrichaceae bacterium]|nr:hypothetical protein [Thiotrichaceae bacterium]